MSQAQSKASTLSSGARAAAQTLNVPIERLEAQIHSTQTKASSPSSPNHHHHQQQHHGEKSLLQQHHEDAIINHIEQNGKSSLPSHQYQQQQTFSQQNSLQFNSNNHHHKSNGNGNGNGIKDDPNDTDEQMSSLNTSPSTKYSLLQFAMQHFRNE